MPDHNWLLSTTAQSAAAIVAIIGGFLVTRLITLGVERATARNQLGDVDARLALVVEQRRRADQWLVAQDFDAFLRGDITDWIVENDGQVTLGEALQKTDWERRGEEDFAQFWERAIEIVRAAFEAAKADGAALEEYEDGDEFARVHKLPTDWDLADAVFLESIKRLRPPRQAGVFGGLIPRIPIDDATRQIRAIWSEGRTQEYQRRAAEWRDLDRQVENLTDERGRLQNKIAATARPQGVLFGFGVLVYFAIVGVMVPIMLLPRSEMSPGARKWVVVLFASGLVAVFAYLVAQIMHLREQRQ